MAGYRRRNHIYRGLPFRDLEKDTVEDRLNLAQKNGVPYVYMELEKGGGKKIKFIMSEDAFRSLTKTDINRLLRVFQKSRCVEISSLFDEIQNKGVLFVRIT